MREIKFVKSEAVFPVIKEILNYNKNVCITVTGMSMYPFLRENTDIVELSDASFHDIHYGDIVLIIRDDGQYVLHRVIWKSRLHFYITGDAQRRVEGPLRPDQLVAVVVSVWRGDKYIERSDIFWRVLSVLWIVLLPIRSFVLKIYRFFD